MTRQREIDWRDWLNRSAVEPWEACALSQDIDPATMWPDRQGYLVGPGALHMYGPQPNDKTIETLVEFNILLKRLNGYLSDPRYFMLVDGKLTLPHFVKWLREMGTTNIPLDLAMLDPTPEETALWKDRMTWSDADEPHVVSRFSHLLDPNARLPASISKKSVKRLYDPDDWKKKARGYGEEMVRDNKKLSVDKIAKKIEARFVSEGQTGRGGRKLAWGTIKRHALTGLKR